MTRQIRRVSLVMLLLFGALFVNLNVIQLLRAEEFANHPANRRLLVAEYGIERGAIVVGDRRIAFSEPTGGDLKYVRRYDPPFRYAHLLGYYSVLLGRDGIERALNEELIGTSTDLLAQNLAELLGERDPVGNSLRLTIDPRVQATAQEALAGRTGAVVALDPTTGAVLAHVSTPGYDPNRLSSHDLEDIRAYWEQLQEAPDDPLADRAIERRFQPGSAFKLIVAASALERGITPDTRFDDSAAYTPPNTTRAIRNFGRGTCAGGGTLTLAEALVVSCNVVFARLGVELGAERLVDMAERFGFNRRLPYVLGGVESVIPRDLDAPATAQSSIGARDVQATAMQMAMVAAGIANDGVLMRPYVVEEILDPSGRPLGGPDSGPWVDGSFTAQAVSRETARTLQDLMVRVVGEGTGRRAAIDGAIVGGKTGTADPGEDMPSHAWFVGFAGSRAEGGGISPQVAVAVVLPSAGDDATGGVDAAPIARAVMEAALGS
ncbi:MAG: peptidoglycan D,D-transpeptidase FtsI family protein [Nitriliruptorales bacterium]